MKIGSSLRRATELGIILTSVATLILAGCGGGGTTSGGGASTSIIGAAITPYKGPFVQGATVSVKDANGNAVTLLSGGTVNASGVVNVTFSNNVAYPLVVEVTGSYYNEISGTYETTTTPLRSIITDASVATNVPVTIVTEAAVSALQNSVGGSFSSANPIRMASAAAALNAASRAFGIPATAVPSFDSATHMSSDANTIRLAALAVVANNQEAGATLIDRVKALANRMAMLNPASAPATVISQATMNAAMMAMTSGASSVLAASAVPPVAQTISASGVANITLGTAAFVEDPSASVSPCCRVFKVQIPFSTQGVNILPLPNNFVRARWEISNPVFTPTSPSVISYPNIWCIPDATNAIGYTCYGGNIAGNSIPYIVPWGYVDCCGIGAIRVDTSASETGGVLGFTVTVHSSDMDNLGNWYPLANRVALSAVLAADMFDPVSGQLVTVRSEPTTVDIPL